MRAMWPDTQKVCMNCGQRIRLVQDYDGQVKWKAVGYVFPDFCSGNQRLIHWPVEEGYLIVREEVQV
jgi:hypothetical protein